MPLKSPSHNLGTEYNYLGEPEDTKTNALGLTWDTQQDTLEPIFHYHLSKKVTGIKQAYELVGLSPEEEEEIINNVVVTRSLLSQITPQSFDLTGVFLGPIKASLKIMLSRACDITSLQEKDLDLATRDASLVSDVKIMIREIVKLKLLPWKRCLIPAQNVLTSLLVACDGS